MTYLELIRDADRQLDKGDITLGEYEEMIEPLKRGIDHIADSDKKAERTAETAQNTSSCAHENDVISRKAAIDALARMMPRSYTPDGSHPADEEIFRAQEIFADCIEALEILPSAQPKGHWILVHPLQEDDTGAYMCSERKVGNWEIDPESYFFCPHCGADMRGDQNE